MKKLIILVSIIVLLTAGVLLSGMDTSTVEYTWTDTLLVTAEGTETIMEGSGWGIGIFATDLESQVNNRTVIASGGLGISRTNVEYKSKPWIQTVRLKSK